MFLLPRLQQNHDAETRGMTSRRLTIQGGYNGVAHKFWHLTLEVELSVDFTFLGKPKLLMSRRSDLQISPS